jgi:hypothetical protein
MQSWVTNKLTCGAIVDLVNFRYIVERQIIFADGDEIGEIWIRERHGVFAV